jgi:type I restriction enzyme R subunit
MVLGGANRLPLFRNKREEIYESFKPFYEVTEADVLTEPYHMYRLQGQIEEKQIVFESEANDFCAVYFVPKRKESVHDHAKMNGILDLAVERFKALEDDEQEEFKSLCVDFRNMYAFLSQVIPYQDSDLEKLYTYLRFLLTKLPRRAAGPAYHLEDEVELEYYRLQKISEGSIDLGTGEGTPLKGPSDVGTGQADEEKIRLSEVIDILNDRFGTDFTEADQLFFDQIEAEAKVDDSLKQAAKVNSMSDFLQIFKKSFEGLVIDRMEGNEDIFSRLMSDAEFRDLAQDNLGQKLYRMLAQGVMSEEDQIKLLIPNNESKTLEFKETFSLDVRKGTKEKYIEKSALKTLGAFLNSEGGDLLNGVGG